MYIRRHRQAGGQTRLLFVILSLVGFSTVGCASSHPHERLNAPPQGPATGCNTVQEFYAYMSDNALLLDMSLHDQHFLPHQARLSGGGEARLSRYAELLADSGGTLAYQAGEQDQELIDSRLETARRFLAEVRLGKAPIGVELGLAGAPGVDAPYAAESRRVGMAVDITGIVNSNSGTGTPGGSGSKGAGPSGGKDK